MELIFFNGLFWQYTFVRENFLTLHISLWRNSSHVCRSSVAAWFVGHFLGILSRCCWCCNETPCVQVVKIFFHKDSWQMIFIYMIFVDDIFISISNILSVVNQNNYLDSNQFWSSSLTNWRITSDSHIGSRLSNINFDVKTTTLVRTRNMSRKFHQGFHSSNRFSQTTTF